jgi:heptosyltransferase-3
MRSTPAPEAGQSPAPRTILVISLRYFGDVLLATPLIRSLRRAYPGAHIDALLFAGTEGMLEGNPDVRGVATIP